MKDIDELTNAALRVKAGQTTPGEEYVKLMGNGEGHTLLILTDAESRLIRDTLEAAGSARGEMTSADRAVIAFNAGIQRGTDRIKAEFDAEQKRRKEAKK